MQLPAVSLCVGRAIFNDAYCSRLPVPSSWYGYAVLCTVELLILLSLYVWLLFFVDYCVLCASVREYVFYVFSRFQTFTFLEMTYQKVIKVR